LARKQEHKWFRLHAPEVLGQADPDGFNAYKEFGPAEHWCWVALRALCASTEMQPVICVTPYHGYTDQQLADLFKVPIGRWIAVKKTLEVAGRIEVDSQNVIRITAWERFGGRYFMGRAGRDNNDAEIRLWSAEEDEAKRKKKKEKAEIFKRVIQYLDQVSHKNFRVGSESAFRHFSARFDEGATEENFRHVIEVKCAQWMGVPDKEIYIRPQTLFNSEKFWGYVNEPAFKRPRPIGGTGSLSILPEERAKYETEAKAEYNERLEAAKERYGWKEVPADAYLNGIPTFEEFFKTFIKRKRQQPDWSLT
jgi:uncharacterized phage protein (TIGR02220 family)